MVAEHSRSHGRGRGAVIDPATKAGASRYLNDRLAALRESPAWANYTYVRDRVLDIKDRDAARVGGLGAPSDYWQEELGNLEYLLDASPLVVERLRQHTLHVTGVWSYEYRSHKKDRPVRKRLEALMDIAGEDLFVPEHRALGGFGFEYEGRLYNHDTLKFYEALAAMDRGAILSEFRRPRGRRVAWEIGAGWGGFAYQFKTLCPDVTYVITDLPEVFLYSGLYLMTVFPDARVRFYGEVDDDELFEGWDELDFVFIPHTRLDLVAPPRMDLAINMVSFQEMTTQQVRAYVHHAAARECPFLYSLNRERSLYNPELEGVHSLIAERYWPHQVEVLPNSHAFTLDTTSKVSKAERAALRAKQLKSGKGAKEANELDYRHTIGWRRLVT
jgi:putative sugar O-methyltransferase